MLLIHISTEQQRVLFHGTKLNVLVLKLGQKKMDFYQTHRSAKGASNAVTSWQAHQTPSCHVWQKSGSIGDSWWRNNPDRTVDALYGCIFGAGYVTRGVLGWAAWEGQGAQGRHAVPRTFCACRGRTANARGRGGGIHWNSLDVQYLMLNSTHTHTHIPFYK